MSKKFCGAIGIALLVITCPLWATATEKKGYFWYQDAAKEHSQRPPRTSAGLSPDAWKMLDEAPCIPSDSDIIQDLRGAKDDFALAIFTVSNCLACADQKQTLMRFKELYGWKIKEFNAQKHTKLANTFNISSAPTILLIRRVPAQWLQLSVRKLQLADIEKTVAGGVSIMRNWSNSSSLR